jgi:hypothetical protein
MQGLTTLGDEQVASQRSSQPGCLNSPVRSRVTSGNLRRPVTSQSTQRNLRPPVFTSTNRIGMLHFGQIGGREFLGMGPPFHQGGSSTLSVTDNSRKRETMINHPAPFNGPIARQFRAIDTVFRHSAISSLDRRNHFRSARSELRLAASHSNDRHRSASTVVQRHPNSSLPISDVCSLGG